MPTNAPETNGQELLTRVSQHLIDYSKVGAMLGQISPEIFDSFIKDVNRLQAVATLLCQIGIIATMKEYKDIEELLNKPLVVPDLRAS